jgi:hypothetical protein
MSAIPPPFYYLDNFQRALDWIAQRYSDLLADEELSFLHQFHALPQQSRALLVRMVMRQGKLFRSTKLCYQEIACTDLAADPLIELGWITRNPSLTIEQLFGLLRKPEITNVFQLSTSDKLIKKNDLLEKLRPDFTESRTLAQWCTTLKEGIYEVNVTSLCERLRLIYFGNLYQDWSEFVLSDLGIFQYEQVEFSASSRGFGTRQDIDDYLHLHRCRERFDNGDSLDEIFIDIPKETYENSWLERRRNKLLFRIAQQYERCGELQSALNIYHNCAYFGARLRAIRVLEKSGEHSTAYTALEIALNNPESEAEYQSLLRMLPRLQRKQGLSRAIPNKVHTIDEFTLPLSFPTLPISVEQAVQLHLSSDQNPAFYVENALINSLFGLLCWPAIFAALPGAFFHPFHQGPADLHSPDFVQRRQTIFNACFSLLDNTSYQQTILATFHAKFGIQSPFVFWGVLDETLLKLALHCIPADHLKKYFERILLDISTNRSGLPDLIQFWPQEKRYQMLEVKGPGDRLQDNQIRWINYCIDHALPVAVCYVQWLEEIA